MLAAAAAANHLAGEKFEKFVRLVLARFNDRTPRIRDYATESLFNMASTCYDEDKKKAIINVMAEGLSKHQDPATKERAAEVVGQIGLATPTLLTAVNELLKNPGEKPVVLVKVCTAIGSLRWVDSSPRIPPVQISTLRGSLESVGQDTKQPEGVRYECNGALQKLPRQ